MRNNNLKASRRSQKRFSRPSSASALAFLFAELNPWRARVVLGIL